MNNSIRFKIRNWLPLAVFLLLPQNLWPAAQPVPIDMNAARKEGKLTIYASISLEDINILARAFEKKYPWIQVTTYRAGKINLGQRMLTEARASEPRRSPQTRVPAGTAGPTRRCHPGKTVVHTRHAGGSAASRTRLVSR